MENLVKNENYIVVQGWMVNTLGLKNNELIIYAIIYGFSQTTGNEFQGSLQYLADWCGATKQGVIKCLKSLCEKNLINKRDSQHNNVKSCAYSVNYECLTKFNSIKQSLTGIKQSLTPPIKQSLTNNIDINITSNKTSNNKKENSTKEKCSKWKLKYDPAGDLFTTYEEMTQPVEIDWDGEKF